MFNVEIHFDGTFYTSRVFSEAFETETEQIQKQKQTNGDSYETN